jgi:putative oxidoreductase
MNGLCCKLSGWTHWLIRFSLAGTFLFHGRSKFMHDAQMMSVSMGVPEWMVYLVGSLEMIAGLLIVVGGCCRLSWATRLSGLIISVIMVGAIIKAHWGVWNVMHGGMEFNVLILAVSIHFLFHGNSCNSSSNSCSK